MKKIIPLIISIALMWGIESNCQTLTNNIDSLQKALKNSNESERSSILLQIGFEYSYTDSFSTGLAYLKQALSMAKKHRQKEIIARTYYHLGDLYFQYDDLSNAQICFTKSYHLSIENKYNTLLVFSSTGLGNVFIELQEWFTAFNYLNKALKIAERERLNEDIPKLLNQLGNLYARQEKYDSAMFYYNQLMIAGKAMNDSIMIGYSYANIGSVLLGEGKNEEAIALFRMALSIRAIRSKPKVVSTIYLKMGQAYFFLNKLERSLECLQKSYDIAQKQGYLSIQSSCCRTISDIYLSMNEFEKSLEYFKQHSVLRDSVYNFEKKQQALKFQIMAQVEQSERQMTILRQKALIRNLMLIISLFITMFLIFLFIRTYRRFRNKIKKQEKTQANMIVTIEQQNRDLVILAMNLSTKQQLISELNVTTTSLSKYPEKQQLENCITSISEKIKGENLLDKKWALFLKHFQDVHPSFYQKLKENHPGLTPYEMRYCAFVKLNLGSKEIAQINNTTIKAAYMFRYRLKKKLSLPDEVGLDSYLSSLS